VFDEDYSQPSDQPQLPNATGSDAQAAVLSGASFVKDMASWVAREMFRVNVRASHDACKRAFNTQFSSYLTPALLECQPAAGGSSVDVAGVLADSLAEVQTALGGRVDPLIVASHTAAVIKAIMPQLQRLSSEQHVAAVGQVRSSAEQQQLAAQRRLQSAQQQASALRKGLAATRESNAQIAADAAHAGAQLAALQAQESRLRREVAAAQGGPVKGEKLHALRQELWEAQQDAESAGSLASSAITPPEVAGTAEKRARQALKIKRIVTPPTIPQT
jgi:hypothetical protein